ncbi:(Fe-S)-binding protein [Nitriliruptoraceae bacterium ZYF776]|nr:(Fe-S)-binding protein [Profundirhabdus halotolerans]
MTADDTTVPPDTAAAALHGSYCPKMCTFACPVTSATGREDAVPWGFHLTVSDLATARLPLVAEAHDRLTACSGCLACQVPCAFDQDVPAQIRDGRAALVAAGAAPAATIAAVDHHRAGRTPQGAEVLTAPPGDADPTVRVAAGCRDTADDLAALVEVLRAAGERVDVHVPDGCCGALLADLGAAPEGAAAGADLPADLPVVAADPHCLGAWEAAGAEVVDVATHLDEAIRAGRLRLHAEATVALTWHDPCVLARGHGVVAAPRRVLAAAGYEVVEPELTGTRTGCSGAGLGLDLLDPDAADATAVARVAQLGTSTVATGCARARDRLAAQGATVLDLAAALRPHLATPDREPRSDA